MLSLNTTYFLKRRIGIIRNIPHVSPFALMLKKYCHGLVEVVFEIDALTNSNTNDGD